MAGYFFAKFSVPVTLGHVGVEDADPAEAAGLDLGEDGRTVQLKVNLNGVLFIEIMLLATNVAIHE